jgi:broad specificity phosphatase PhoE
MKNHYVFFRHAPTKIDKDVPAEKWVISDEGIEEVCEIISSGKFDDIDVIISSSEKKAIQTAFYLAERIEKEIILIPNFKELERRGQFVESNEDYDTKVWRVFKNPLECSFGWETAQQALVRFKRGLRRIENSYADKKIFLVSHGIILALYFADHYNWDSQQTFEYWKKLGFCESITLYD